mmetsp:Transcript_57394/g.119208  ORF Transcript_57394/g.119208 Transcript_57394/m.119208 type:complete len:224 (+) Transcript_57394:32-703(+)|eukprot:s3359_g4.t1
MAPGMAGVRSKQPVACPGAAPRGRPCQLVKAHQAASGGSTAAPIRAAPPPWATHGPEVLDANLRGKKAHAHHCVHFRGTDSLASMHFIDQGQAANARLSQKLAMASTVLQRQRLSTLQEDHLSSSRAGSFVGVPTKAAPKCLSESRTKGDMPKCSKDDSGNAGSGHGLVRPISAAGTLTSARAAPRTSPQVHSRSSTAPSTRRPSRDRHSNHGPEGASRRAAP